jgi:hypothetical protein
VGFYFWGVEEGGGVGVGGNYVYTYFQLVLQEIFLVGKFAIEAEESLLVCGEGLQVVEWLARGGICSKGSTHANVDLVLLVRIHGCDWS